MAPGAYILRETAISVVINTLLSALAFLALFGRGGPVAVWGAGGYVADFAPQGFMIALMASLVPGLLARRARAAGKVPAISGTSRLPASPLRRGLLLGVLGAGGGVALAGSVLAATGADAISHGAALTAKMAFGAALALLVTKAGLRAQLVRR